MQVTLTDSAKRAADKIQRGKAQYVEAQKRTGVPWYVVGLMHYRESNCNFDKWLHNGDPMKDKAGNPCRTVNKPRDRPVDPNVDWVTGAVDALSGYKIDRWNVATCAYALEKFNGFGYRSPSINIPSPYLWGGTNRQKKGKFVKDHVYSKDTWDTQLGCMAILQALEIFESTDYDQCPKASDPPVQRQMRNSKTIWGGIFAWLGGILANLNGMWEHLATPWGFACFALFTFVITVGLYLVIKGRFDVQKLLEHLSPAPSDETEAVSTKEDTPA